MKQVLVVHLRPTPEQRQLLLRTLVTFNAACTAIARVAWRERCFAQVDLQHLVYY